jgi:hypothetical protein
MKMMYDAAVIGGGAAGLTAAQKGNGQPNDLSQLSNSFHLPTSWDGALNSAGEESHRVIPTGQSPAE